MTHPLRLNKVLASLGYGSRRAVDTMITAGRVQVNGVPAYLGQRVDEQATITVDGQSITHHLQKKIVVALHKPRGVVTTKKDPFAKITVMDFLPKRLQHLYPIGRLDKESRGLLLLTNDGALADRLTHPRYEHEKEYEVTVVPQSLKSRRDFQSDIKQLATTVILPESQSTPVQVIARHFDLRRQRGHVILVLREGRKRQIRKLLGALGYTVTDLLRTRIGAVQLGGLKEGEYVTIEPSVL